MQFKRNLPICTKWASKLKVHFSLKCYCSKFILTSVFIWWEKSYEDIYDSPPHVSVITGNILITIIRFTRYHLLLASSNTFMTDSMYWYNSDLSKLEWTLLLFNFNYIRDLTNRSKLFSNPVAECTYFSHQARKLKTDLLGLISNFS